MSRVKPYALVIVGGLIVELIAFVVLTFLGATNEIIAIVSLVCMMVTSFYAGDVGSREPGRDDHRDARHDG